MKRSSLDVFLNQSFDDRNREDENKEMGLFTFYRQQQEERNRSQSKQSKSQQKKKKKKRWKEIQQKRFQTDHKQKSIQGKRSDENCSFFLKNICLKNLKQKFFTTNQLSRSEQLKQHLKTNNEDLVDTKCKYEESRISLQEKQKNTKRQSQRAFKTFEEIIKAQNIDLPSEQKKIAKVFPKKMTRLTLKVRTQANPQKEPKYERFIKDTQEQPQNQEELKEHSQIKGKMKSLQQSFLEKVRIKEGSKVSKTVPNQDEFHIQNKKYIVTLIDRFQLPQNCQNQAAKMLRQTLKFPQLSFMDQHLKTQSYSPSRYPQSIKKERKSFSFRKKEKSVANYILHTNTNKSKNRFLGKLTKKDIFNVTKSIFS